MTTSSSPDPDQNPYEFVADSDDPDELSQERSRLDPTDDQVWEIPPVEGSYWISVLGFGLIAFSICSISPGPGMPPLGIWVGISSLVALAFALIRLALHRWNIQRVIETGTYHGGPRFEVWYLIQSLLLAYFCLMGGGMVFFGLCTFFIAPMLFSRNTGTINALLLLDTLLSLIITGFLVKLGVPRYR